MKRTIALLLVFAMVLSWMTCSVSAASSNIIQSGNFKYILLDDGTAFVTGYIGTESHVVVPAQIDGLRVSIVGGWSGDPTVKTIELANGITEIRREAFITASALETLIVPKSVKTIGVIPFSACPNSKKILVADDNPYYADIDGVLYNKDISELIFHPGSRLETVFVVPKSVKSIAEGAFYNSTNLKKIVLPEGITAIGLRAFYRCTKLTQLNFPKGLRSIGNYAFQYTKITRAILPNTLTELEESAFFSTRLETVFYQGTEEEWNTKVLPTQKSSSDLRTVAVYFGEWTRLFPDVSMDSWYFDAVTYAADRGFMTGYQNGNFGPSHVLQRQDFVVALARIAKVDLTAYENHVSEFADVVDESYYAWAIAWAVENGIITGYNATKFGVGDPVTREQACTMLYRYCKTPVIDGDSLVLDSYPDKTSVSTFAKDALIWAVENGVISGTSKGHLAPTAKAARAQIVTIFMRMDLNDML